MRNLYHIGRIFYGIAIAGMGLQSMYAADFPYMLIPAADSVFPNYAILVYISGAILFLCGACIVIEKKARTIAILLGTLLLLVFCFYYVPYELFASNNYMHLGEWENAEKELALSAGAFIIASCFQENNESSFIKFFARLIPLGTILFAITITSFGIDHFLYATAVAGYIPSYVPYHLFWTYVAGAALLASGIAIILRIKLRLAATLLGTMIFIWFIMLHIPKVITSADADRGGEITSAFLALAYSGIAFVIAGLGENKSTVKYI